MPRTPATRARTAGEISLVPESITTRSGRSSAFDVVEELEPVVGADVDVEQDDVDRLGGEQLPRGRERSRLDHPVTLELEVDPAEKPERRLVVDDENRGARAIHRAESRRSVPARSPARTRLATRE